MDISDLHDKDFKIMVIKILLSTEECLNKMETSTQRQKYKKVLHTSHRTEEYNNGNGK